MIVVYKLRAAHPMKSRASSTMVNIKVISQRVAIAERINRMSQPIWNAMLSAVFVWVDMCFLLWAFLKTMLDIDEDIWLAVQSDS